MAQLNTVTPPPTHSTLRPLSVVIGLEGLALGGCPINALDLGRALRRRGHRVAVFAVDEDVRVSLLPYAKKSGFEVAVLPVRAGIAARAMQIRRVAARESADIIHVFGPWLGPAATAASAAWNRRAAVVTNWTMQNVDYTPRQTPLIVGTRMLATEAERSHRGSVWLMEPPVDLEADAPHAGRAAQFRSEIGLEADEIAAVTVSRIDSQMKAESIGHAIRAVGRLDHPRLRLVVVGDGNAFEKINREASRINAGLGRRAVILTGAMHDPRPAYAGADIMLAMGGSALRALAHGKPLIVLGERGFARTFEPASTAYFYEQGFFGDRPVEDPAGHLMVLLRSLLGPSTQRELGSFGLAEVQARFGLESGAEKLERIYQKTLQATPGVIRRWSDSAYVTARAVGHEGRSLVRRHAGVRPGQ